MPVETLRALCWYLNDANIKLCAQHSHQHANGRGSVLATPTKERDCDRETENIGGVPRNPLQRGGHGTRLSMPSSYRDTLAGVVAVSTQFPIHFYTAYL